MPCHGRSCSILVELEWTLVDFFPHSGQRATREAVLASRVMASSLARIPMRSSKLGAGSTVRDSDIGNLDDLQVLLGCQLASPPHQKLGRTVIAGATSPEQARSNAAAAGWRLTEAE